MMNKHSTATMNSHQLLQAATHLTDLSSISDSWEIHDNRIFQPQPHTYVASNSDSVLYKYAEGHGRDLSEHKERLLPCIFQIVNNSCDDTR